MRNAPAVRFEVQCGSRDRLRYTELVALAVHRRRRRQRWLVGRHAGSCIVNSLTPLSAVPRAVTAQHAVTCLLM